MKRCVFMISDGTGLTSESLGNSLLSQFEPLEFTKKTLPYIDNLQKADKVIDELNECYKETGLRPIAFITLVNAQITNHIKKSNACIVDLFNTFLAPLEQELNIKSSHTVGRTHSVANSHSYNRRIEAIDYTLAHDDGVKVKNYDKADIVLIGVSRCGKTPSCLYMALQFGLLAANYPFTDEELRNFSLPEILRPFKSKLFGLTIDPERLCHIRTKRRPDSKYAALEQCRIEVKEVEEMYKKEKIPFINSTTYSIEEISTRILSKTGIKRKI